MTKEYTELFRQALVDTGRITPDSKLNFVEVRGETSSDHKVVVFEVVKKKCRKPYMIWELAVDIVRELVFFDKSVFYYL